MLIRLAMSVSTNAAAAEAGVDPSLRDSVLLNTLQLPSLLLSLYRSKTVSLLVIVLGFMCSTGGIVHVMINNPPPFGTKMVQRNGKPSRVQVFFLGR